MRLETDIESDDTLLCIIVVFYLDRVDVARLICSNACYMYIEIDLVHIILFISRNDRALQVPACF